MNIKPLADRVLVLPAPAEEKVGGIIIPDTAKEKPLHGKIVAVGNGTKMKRWYLKRVTKSFMANMQAQNLNMKATKYLIMRQSDVLAVVDN
jgi:chaperonin GroES